MTTPWDIYAGEPYTKNGSVIYGQARHDGPSDRDRAVAFTDDAGLAREIARRWTLLALVNEEHSRSYFRPDGTNVCGWDDGGPGCGMPYPCPTRKILDSR